MLLASCFLGNGQWLVGSKVRVCAFMAFGEDVTEAMILRYPAWDALAADQPPIDALQGRACAVSVTESKPGQGLGGPVLKLSLADVTLLDGGTRLQENFEIPLNFNCCVIARSTELVVCSPLFDTLIEFTPPPNTSFADALLSRFVGGQLQIASGYGDGVLPSDATLMDIGKLSLEGDKLFVQGLNVEKLGPRAKRIPQKETEFEFDLVDFAAIDANLGRMMLKKCGQEGFDHLLLKPPSYLK